jgi:hypothetical protein
MVDKMSRFSRSFISLNSLSQIIQKNRSRVQSKAFLRWVRSAAATIKPQSGQDEASKEVKDMRKQLEMKDQEIQKMEMMFKEYSTWRSKLEQIEGKMKGEVDFWKQSCDKVQKENDRL